ncbi:hypothetical protein BH09BAC3_BH09BAC3_26700 [soil metagenome]
MQLRKDIILDLIYSIIFSIVLLLNSNELGKTDQSALFVFKNFILTGILCLWIKSLARNQAPIFLIKDYPASKNTPFKSSYTLLRDFIQGKAACFALMFCLYSFFIEYNSHRVLLTIYFELFRTIMLGFYALCMLMISVAYLKVSPSNWRFTIMALGPFMLFFILYGLFDIKNSIYFGILPANFGIVFLNAVDLPETIIVVGLSLILTFTMALFLMKSINRLLTGKKSLTLDITRVN